MYDSKSDTIAHIMRVQELVDWFSDSLKRAAKHHDKSKLEEPEKHMFDEFTPKLKTTTYGSEEYKSFLNSLRPALEHHYAENSHHPEHHPNGIQDMTLFDLVEMFLDWKAASERHEDGSMERSIKINAERFKINPQLVSILEQTRRQIGWK